MPHPGFTRPDLCSIPAATEQTEHAESARDRLTADGRPPAGDDPPAPPGDRHRPRYPPGHCGGRARRGGHRGVCLLLAAYAVVQAHGETGIIARREPATIDGLVWASSMLSGGRQGVV